jgi:hypothetical protein
MKVVQGPMITMRLIVVALALALIATITLSFTPTSTGFGAAVAEATSHGGGETQQPCGGQGQPACPTGGGTQQPCGGQGQPACPTGGGTQQPCGGQGQPACPTGDKPGQFGPPTGSGGAGCGAPPAPPCFTANDIQGLDPNQFAQFKPGDIKKFDPTAF